VWRGRDFRLAWAAATVNNTGDWVLLIALPVYVFTVTGSGTSTALLFVLELLVAGLLGPIGGSLVDRWDLRRCLIATNLAQAVTLLPLLAVSSDRIWPIYGVVLAQSVLTRLNNPANVALVPRLVEPGQLTQANAALAASGSIARFVGAPLGGVLVAAGGVRPVALLDAASFAAVALAVVWIRVHPRPGPEPDHPIEFSGVRGGVREIRTRPVLRALLGVNALSQVAQGAFIVLFVVYVVDALDRDGGDVGIIRGTMAIGALIGALVITRLASRLDPFVLMVVGYAGMGAVSFLFWNAHYFTHALVAYVVLFSLSGLPGSALEVGLMTTLQTACPPAVLGRVFGVMEATASVGAALGSIVAGVLVDITPLPGLLDAQAAIYVMCAILLVRMPRAVREITADQRV
jgi:predicted MFS family arabinose efflux permease